MVVDRAQVQIVLHGLEGGLDLDELDVEPPQFGRVFAGEIGAQQIAAFAPAHLAQLGAIEREAEGGAFGRNSDIDEAPGRSNALARAAPSFMSSSISTIKLHGGDLLEAPP